MSHTMLLALAIMGLVVLAWVRIAYVVWVRSRVTPEDILRPPKPAPPPKTETYYADPTPPLPPLSFKPGAMNHIPFPGPYSPMNPPMSAPAMNYMMYHDYYRNRQTDDYADYINHVTHESKILLEKSILPPGPTYGMMHSVPSNMMIRDIFAWD